MVESFETFKSESPVVGRKLLNVSCFNQLNWRLTICNTPHHPLLVCNVDIRALRADLLIYLVLTQGNSLS